MDDSNKMVSITVLLAGRPYPLKINASDEPSIRKVVKEINDHVNNFQLKYTTKDKQDCLSMAALTYAVDLAKTKSRAVNVPTSTASESMELLNQLSEIDTFLDAALQLSKKE